MNPQSLGGRRVNRIDQDKPQPCQSYDSDTDTRCNGPQHHLFSTVAGEVMGFCDQHRQRLLADLPPDWTALEVTP